MGITVYIDKYKHARYKAFKWRYELDVVHKVVLALCFACLTGLAAQVRFYLPWTPVPITGQTFAVLLGAILLGRWGGVSQIMYAGIGAAGVPWFAGWNGGIGVITGATGGYIIGFIIAAFFLGYFVDKYIRSRSFLTMLALMLFANFVLIYGPGLLQLYVWLSFVKGFSVGFWELLMMGAIPFIVSDITKVVAAAAITRVITPKRAYNGEVDVEKWESWRIP
jgi:biotin transport system substrate-specific component